VGVQAALGTLTRGAVEVQITVKDRGAGIPAKEISHIFEPFYRSPSVISSPIRGTGLGLSLAMTIARAMGGTITVSSQPGAGSSFTLHLPVIAPHGLNAEIQELNTAQS
jgi:signal transduction histidine kinase